MNLQKITSGALLFSLVFGSNMLPVYSASQGVTSITTYTTPAVPSSYTSGGQTYNWGTGNDVHLDTFTTAGGTFSPSIIADEVIVRRVDNAQVSGDRCRLFVEQTVDNFTYGPTYPSGVGDNCDISKVIAGRIINRGALDVFANLESVGKEGNENNIERVDFIFNDGIELPTNITEFENSGHLVTEKSGNNNMIIAPILSLDGTGAPATYAPLTKVWPSNMTTEPIRYSITTFSTTNSFVDNEDSAPFSGPVRHGGQAESLGMVFVTADDLGLTAGQTYYGFSYFSQDLYDDTQPNNVIAGVTIADYTTYPNDTSAAGDVADADIYGGTAGYFSFNYTISGEVFQDANGNGQEDSETGISDIKVSLYTDNNGNGIIDGADAVIATTDTAPDGSYQFNAASGDYLVVPDSADTDMPAGYTSSGTDPLPVTVDGANETGADFPFYNYATISDSLIIDTDEDGIQDGGEFGFSGATVELYSSTGALIDTTTTDSNGDYTFSNVVAGDYYVEFTAPSGYAFSPTGQGGDSTLDSDANIATGRTPVQTIAAGANITGDNDALIALSSTTISDTVWIDTDEDGVQDGSELGFSGATVQLYSSTGALIDTTTTDTNGDYTFAGMPDGDYYVEITLPTNYLLTDPDLGGDNSVDSDADTTTLRTPVQTVMLGDTVTDENAFGLLPRASITDNVIIDTDEDGIQDGGEFGFSGATVQLYTSTGTLVDTTTTDTNGEYTFSNIVPGDYYVDVTLPATYVFSDSGQGADTGLDSDVNTTTGETPVQTLTGGTTTTGQNDALIQTGNTTISDTVWIDTNEDGVQDGSELGFSGATVELYSSTGALIATTTTDNNGDYTFSGMAPGDYYVEITLPNNYLLTDPDLGGDNSVDSDADTTTLRTPVQTVMLGDTVTDENAFGLLPRASITDNVIIDTDEDGIQDGGEFGFSGATVQLYSSTGTLIDTTTTDTNGEYTFSNIVPGDYYVDVTLPATYVFSDSGQGADTSLDSDVNTTTGETPVQTLAGGTTTTGQNDALIAAARSTLSGNVWTDIDENGLQGGSELGFSGATVELYSSTGALIATTTTDTNGDYTFSNILAGDYYVEITLPTNHILTNANQGADDSIDSDANTSSLRTSVQTIAPGTNVTQANDFGLLPRATITDNVWVDTDEDGVQDGSELGFSGATVELYSSTGALIATTTTDTNGDYSFTEIVPGDYYTEITLPNNYLLTEPTLGGDTSIDSDANTTTRRTATQTLVGGNTTTDANDFGLLPRASITDTVILDVDEDGIEDLGEFGFSGITVELYSSTGTLVATTTTDTNGDYSFTEIVPGDYYVEVTPPAGHSFSPQSQGGDNTIDSDTDATTGRTPVQTLVGGTTTTGNYSSKIYENFSIINGYIWNDSDRDGIRDASETGFSGTTVQLYTSTGTLVDTVTATSTGYSFVDLLPGDYYVSIASPSGYKATGATQGSDTSKDSDINENLTTTNIPVPIGTVIDGLTDGGFVEILTNTGGGSGGGGGGGGSSTPSTPVEPEPEIIPEPEVEAPVEPEPTPEVVEIPEPEAPTEPEPTPEVVEIIEPEVKTIIPQPVVPIVEIPSQYIPFPNLFQFPRLLPQTGTALEERTRVIINSKINTTPPNWATPGMSEDIDYWKNTVLPFSEDRDEDEYIVIPSLGVVVPLSYVPRNSEDFEEIVKNGTQIKDFSLQGGKNYLKYLDKGVMQYPGTLPIGLSAGAGKEYTGNTVIFGHSSYWKENNGKYDTIFGLLPTLDQGEEVWVFSRTNNSSSTSDQKGAYDLRKHTITKSYETNPSDTQILSQENYSTPHLTLFTCTPIGGITGRWVVQAELKNVVTTQSETTNETNLSEQKESVKTESSTLSKALQDELDLYVHEKFVDVPLEERAELKQRMLTRITELEEKYSQEYTFLKMLEYIRSKIENI